MESATSAQNRSDIRIGSEEAARRLGVKRETIYAYVSRGFLTSRRVQGKPGSTFSLAEVEALRRSGARSGRSSSSSFRLPTVTTKITAVTERRLRYRGRDATALARTSTFEAVAHLLWTGELRDEPLTAPTDVYEQTRAIGARLPANTDRLARIRVALSVAAALDPLRFDVSGSAVQRSAATAIACMTGAAGDIAHGRSRAAAPAPRDLPPSNSVQAGEIAPAGAVAQALWRALSPQPPEPELLRGLDAALVLVADRGLAASTVAARAAASARANPYAVINAGLASLEGPLHGAVGDEAHVVLLNASNATDGIGASVAPWLRLGRPVPGVRPGPPDPRAGALLDILGASRSARRALDTVGSLLTTLDPRGASNASVELAIAALAVAGRMPVGAGEAIFAIGRSAGWIAHALEEYAEEPMRWRAQEIYIGPP